jgi:hypothetical protein
MWQLVDHPCLIDKKRQNFLLTCGYREVSRPYAGTDECITSRCGSNPQSVGGFATVLLDINSAQAESGYPVDWTKYEYTFSGISGQVERRIGFRYFVPNTAIPRGIGIDLFKFEK